MVITLLMNCASSFFLEGRKMIDIGVDVTKWPVVSGKNEDLLVVARVTTRQYRF